VAVWLTADTHSGHAGALSLYRRPFASVAEMDAAMVTRWKVARRRDRQPVRTCFSRDDRWRIERHRDLKHEGIS